MASPNQRDNSIFDALSDRKPMQNFQHIPGDMIKFWYLADESRCSSQYTIKARHCIVLYLDIYKAPLAVGLMTIQRRFQREHSEETERFSSNGQRWKDHLPKSQPEFVGEGCSTKRTHSCKG